MCKDMKADNFYCPDCGKRSDREICPYCGRFCEAGGESDRPADIWERRHRIHMQLVELKRKLKCIAGRLLEKKDTTMADRVLDRVGEVDRIDEELDVMMDEDCGTDISDGTRAAVEGDGV